MKSFGSSALLAMVAMACLVPAARASVGFKVVANFNGPNGANPKGALIRASDGNLYGTTMYGGTSNAGTVFCLSADATKLTTLYSFTGGADGGSPFTALLQAADGALYGTACNGGISNAGTIFRVTTGGDFNVLALFSITNGSHPIDGPLIQASDGKLYGATGGGGPYDVVTSQLTGYGVVFCVTTNGDLTTPVLFDSTNGTRATGLFQGSDGNFYGTTLWGGPTITNATAPLGCGIIFKLAPDGTLTTLYPFRGGLLDGSLPYCGLAMGPDGNFYGTTYSGGPSIGFGEIYRITPDGSYTILYRFSGGSDGGNPYAGLTLGPDGNFYGTAQGGGSGNAGTIFRVTTNGVLTTLHPFTFTEGYRVHDGLVQGSDGNFYGTATYGGTYSKGAIFRLSVPLPPVIRSITAANGQVQLTWSAVASQIYQVQYTTNLLATNWTGLGFAVVATNGTMTATDTLPAPGDPAATQQRWYRVVLQ